MIAVAETPANTAPATLHRRQVRAAGSEETRGLTGRFAVKGTRRLYVQFALGGTAAGAGGPGGAADGAEAGGGDGAAGRHLPTL